MVSTCKKKKQQKRQLSQLAEALNDLVIGNSVNENVLESEKLEQQNNAFSNDFEKIDNSVRQNQVIENRSDNQITRVVSSAVTTVEKCIHHAILTALDNVVVSRGEMAVKSITGSVGHETGSEVQNPDRIDFVRNIRNTPLMSASSHMDLDNVSNRNDATRKDVDFEDGGFPALKSYYDRRENVHHN